MRKFAVLAALASCAAAQSPLTNILSTELERNFSVLKGKGDPPPYFIGYSVSDNESFVLSAADGAITGQNQDRSRLLDISVRVGTPKFDNYRRINGQSPRFTVTSQIALSNQPASIRQADRKSTRLNSSHT